jgi:hypothetical protein
VSSTRKYTAQVLPPDQTFITDPFTGVELTFLTTKTRSKSYYFHERSWLADESLVIFDGHLGVMAYITATGELVVLGEGLGSPTCATTRNTIFCVRANDAAGRGGHTATDVLELMPVIEISSDPMVRPSTVTIHERVIATLPTSGSINANHDDTLLSVRLPGPPATANVVGVDTGNMREVLRGDPPYGRMSHLQWSRTSSNLLSVAMGPDWNKEGEMPRLHIIDPASGEMHAPYYQRPGELFTHESWWIDDQILYCGAPQAINLPGDTQTNQDMAHVNVLDTKTGVVRILGAGSWWSDEVVMQTWRRNWWHCAGSDDGRWVVGDTMFGELALFEAATSRPTLLTTGHRVKTGTHKLTDHAAHPEPGWDRKGEKVIFSSHLLSGGESADPNVCVATIPDEWQKRNPTKRR